MTKDQENSLPEKTKSQLRAERREKQEAQRAAKPNKGGKQTNDVKAGGAQEKPKQPSVQKSALSAASSIDKNLFTATGRKHTESQSSVGSGKIVQNNAAMVDDISSTGDSKQISTQAAQNFDISTVTSSGKQASLSVHPAFHQLGLKISSDLLLGSDVQCIALIEAFKLLIKEYHPPADKIFSREIENAMKPCLSFISAGRPLSPALASLVKQLKYQLSHVVRSNSEEEAKTNLLSWLDDFLEQKITLSTKSICLTVTEKLRSFKEKPVILTYSYSSIIEEIFLYAHKNGAQFDVVLVDSLPQKQGQILLKRLIEIGVNCRYVLINGLTHIINDANLVLLGADGLLANGSVVCTLGGSQVAMVAKHKNIPVLIACQTYKFCEKIQTGTLEVGWPGNEVMPSDFVTGVVTELRMLPCSAVPAVLRVKQLT